ncbi:MAG: hypothetical protein ACREE2_12125 [Stellaceae bacterium]
MTGMIEPFNLTALQKPATYLVPLEGLVRYRDTEGEFQRFYLSNDPTVRNAELDVRNELILEQNSLCYVTLQPTFRLPAYIADRFNLLIRDVYRGLLVGTGPLVDPGFVGRLSIPLHNFTSNKYPLRADEGFVYFEFTKLSWTNGDQPFAPPDWLRPAVDVQPPFPGSKNLRRTIDNYLVEATGGLPAESAVGAEIRRLSDTSETIIRRTRIFTIVGFVAIGGLILTALADVIMSVQVYLGAQQVVQAAKADLDNAVGKATERTRALQAEIEQTRQVVRELESRISSAGSTPRPAGKP